MGKNLFENVIKQERLDSRVYLMVAILNNYLSEKIPFLVDF